MSKSKRKSSRATRKNLLILFLVFVILGAGYMYIRYYETDPSMPDVATDAGPDYIILENRDSVKYMEVVMYNNNVNINTVAHDFYGDNAFWSYIFLENEKDPAVKANPLDIPKGTVLRLPHVSGLKNGDGSLNSNSVEKAKVLADTILSRLPSFN